MRIVETQQYKVATVLPSLNKTKILNKAISNMDWRGGDSERYIDEAEAQGLALRYVTNRP